LTAGEFIIRNCEDGDLLAIQRIENVSFEDPYSLDIFWALYSSPKRIFRVALFQEKVIGYSVAKIETKEKDSMTSHIVSLAVEPSMRHKGIGTKMLNDIISQTKKGYPDCRKIELEVRNDNRAAIGLYQKFGFREIGTISNYYGRGEGAVVMRFDF
jgi:ribosomal-protein-alanine N-acetyltransferase